MDAKKIEELLEEVRGKAEAMLATPNSDKREALLFDLCELVDNAKELSQSPQGGEYGELVERLRKRSKRLWSLADDVDELYVSDEMNGSSDDMKLAADAIERLSGTGLAGEVLNSGTSAYAHFSSHDLADAIIVRAPSIEQGLIDEVRHRLLRAADALGAQGWVSVKDRLPGDGQWVIVACGSQVVDGIVFTKPDGYYPGFVVRASRSFENITSQVTHWMPLPPAPLEEGEER